MSFPPRQPPPIISMGPMPPMMQNPYGYPPMGMPPMGMPPMGMNPMMQRPHGPPPNFAMMNMNMSQSVTNLKAALSQPVTKVFVGNISERVPDPMMRSMLQRCGNVMTWKRVEGPSGKMQAFGFCEYDNPQSTLRCIRLLNGYEIAEKKLLVKVDQKTRELLGEYIKRKDDPKAPLTKNAKKAAMLKKNKAEDGELDDDESINGEKNINLELVDEDTLKEDRVVLNALELILRQYQKDLVPPPAPVVETPTPVVVIAKPAELINSPLKLNADDLGPIKTSNSNSAYDSKDRQRDNERSKSIEKQREPSNRDRDRRVRDSTPDRYRNIANSRSTETDVKAGKYHGSKSRSRSPVDHRRRKSPERTSQRDDKNVTPPVQNRYNKNNSDLNKENNQRPPVSNLTSEELEEERERKKLERRLREKEQAYRERLKQWEDRENKRRRQYTSEKKNEIHKRKILLKEAKKLRQFMEDYEDDKDDSNFYKGSNLEKKLKAREKEIEIDNRDRQREKEELEELKKKLAEKGFADVELEAKKLHEDEFIRMKTKFEKLEQSSSSSSSSSEEEEPEEQEKEEIKKSPDFNNRPETTEQDIQTPTINEKQDIEEEKHTQILQLEESLKQQIELTKQNLMSDGDSTQSPFINSATDSPLQLKNEINENYSLSSPNSNSPLYINSTTSHYLPASTATHVTIKTFIKKSIQPIIKAFADEDDESNGPQLKRAKLSTLTDSENKLNSEERKKAVKKLVESIPTDRDELFAYNVDWEQLDENLMDKRIKPWINKKIIEYIGEEEATLNDFICSKIQQKTKPEKLLEEVKVILDDEAELFVKKMWRLIVYETESKRQGLSK